MTQRTDLAVILVAGYGSRLRPLTDQKPKALVEVGGKSILLRAIDHLIHQGVHEIVLATGYCAEAIHTATASLPIRIRYCHNSDYEHTQNSISLLRCANAIGQRSFFKLDGDVLFQSAILDRLSDTHAPLSVAVDCSGTLGDEEMKVLATATNSRLLQRFGKQLSPQECAGESIGIERIDASCCTVLFDALQQAENHGETQLYYEEIYNRLIEKNWVAKLCDVSDLTWTEVDTLEDLNHANSIASKLH